MNWNRVRRVLTNKYVVVTAVFVVLIVFVDEYSLRVSSRLKREVNQLKAEEKALTEAIAADSAAAARLKDNLEEKERYGRENYYMKRGNEDVFVIK